MRLCGDACGKMYEDGKFICNIEFISWLVRSRFVFLFTTVTISSSVLTLFLKYKTVQFDTRFQETLKTMHDIDSDSNIEQLFQ